MVYEGLVVEPVVTAEKLASLLAVGCELSQLDFKEQVDLDEHAELVEFAKDVAALRSCGGYLVVGVDDTGCPTGDLDARLAAKFDEANLRQKLSKFLSPADVIPARHIVNGANVVLVYIPRHPSGFTVVKGVGEYTKPGGGQHVVLRPGDVFIRRGTSSERWSEADVESLLGPRDTRLRETHRVEFAAMVAAIQAGAQGQAIASGPVQALVWELDQTSFDSAVIELVRRNDMVPIRLLLIRSPEQARSAAAKGDRDEFATILDRLISLAAIATTLARDDIAEDVIETLQGVYSNPPSNELGAHSVGSSAFWLEILARVEALGGLAVVLKSWRLVRELAAQPAPDKWYASWLRHGLTMAARSRIFPTTGSGQEEQGALIPLARRVVHRLRALRPYLEDDSGYDPEPGADIPLSDTVLDSLCAFDALASLVVLTRIDPDAFDPQQYYPSFGHYYSRRSVPAWARLLEDGGMREELLPEIDDETLGRAMSGISDIAHSVAQGRWGIWSLDDDLVRAYVQAWRVKNLARQAPANGDS